MAVLRSASLPPACVARWGRRFSPALSQAVLPHWDGALDQSVGYLRAAPALATEMGVAGEIEPIDMALAQVRAKRNEVEAAR